MSKKIIVLILFVGIAIAMFVTNPSKEDHKKALVELSNELVEEAANQVGKFDIGAGIISKTIGKPIASIAADQYFDKSLIVHNYGLFSIGEIEYKDKTKKVTFGIFTHVFAPSKEDMKEGIKNKLFN